MEPSKLRDDEIKARKYYNVDWFTECVPRFIPKPRVLYRRVRAVFETFGPALLNEKKLRSHGSTTWRGRKRTRLLLSEILDGFYSDHENFHSFSSCSLTCHGHDLFRFEHLQP
jgi:hypothetical protein